jgi:hypothetical protein
MTAKNKPHNHRVARLRFVYPENPSPEIGPELGGCVPFAMSPGVTVYVDPDTRGMVAFNGQTWEAHWDGFEHRAGFPKMKTAMSFLAKQFPATESYSAAWFVDELACPNPAHEAPAMPLDAPVN